MSKLKLFEEIYQLHESREKWIKSVPSDIRDSYFDNTYVNSLQKQIDLLMDTVFTASEKFEIEWFLYEWYCNRMLNAVDQNGSQHSLGGIDDYIEFLTNEGWD